jgi:membrane protease YdiL (CAAX protease family)
MNEIKQHTVFQSILLHLLPGVLVLVSIFGFSSPFFTKSLGLDDRLRPVVGYLFGLLIGLVLTQIVILLFAGKSETEKFTIRETIKYTQKSQTKEYLSFVPALILYFILLFVVVAPIIQPTIIAAFFPWWPEQYNFQRILQDPASIAGYQGIKILVVFYILLSGIFGPLVEELYFRGYLLPRMEEYAGKWAPFLNTVLFSIYHFFSPWENLVRIVAIDPLVYLVWKKRDIRFGILVHVIVNTLGGIFMLIVIS